jgi:hypothetical protein
VREVADGEERTARAAARDDSSHNIPRTPPPVMLIPDE